MCLIKTTCASPLQNQSMTINAIAVRLGFSDPANFRRAFRKWTGCSPSEFRGQQDCKQ
ncbi:helix-turn-helix domain-containing protein [Zhongshania borealis]|uniref:helix-turn-helix domain-containing protein n=1 Tax=Zhongshania borealis TaxID=889488 RepID=UPI003CD0A710